MGMRQFSRQAIVLGLRAARFSAGGVLAALFLAAVCPMALQAQFTGPALSLPPQPVEVPVPTNDPSLLEPNEKDFRIGIGDVLLIHVFETDYQTTSLKVSVEGTVQLPLIGTTRVAGLTVEQAEDAIARQLIAGGFYTAPQVTVEIGVAVNQYATITGELHAVVPLVGIRRLFDVLASGSSLSTGSSVNAGIQSGVLTGAGWPAGASHTVTVIRQGEPKPIVINIGTDPAKIAAANIVIVPHDLIVVSRVGVVYILGAFAKQGAIPLDQDSPLTLLQATTLSGGEGYEGRYEDLRLIRTNGLTRTVVKVDLKRIIRGQDPDPILQADDVIFLPTNILKGAIKSGGIGTLLGLADIAIIALQR
jgi:polysaccharide export outer membrane protein